jgi:hypothetical protein
MVYIYDAIIIPRRIPMHILKNEMTNNPIKVISWDSHLS